MQDIEAKQVTDFVAQMKPVTTRKLYVAALLGTFVGLPARPD